MSSQPPVGLMSVEVGLSRYLALIKTYPMLSAENEHKAACRYKEYGDASAAETLATSHLRLVAKIAMQYRGYGLPITDIIAEGNLGLMHAIRRFDPDRSVRFATYAVWWIRASIQEYVLRSFSLVRIGTTTSEKKLFFSLRRAKAQISAFEEGDLRAENAELIAAKLGVKTVEVVDMNRRLSGDGRLNTIRSEDGGEEWQDRLVDDRMGAEEELLAAEEGVVRQTALTRGLAALNERERSIFAERRLNARPTTLDQLAGRYGVSRERIRQIEVRAFGKVQKSVLAHVADLQQVA